MLAHCVPAMLDYLRCRLPTPPRAIRSKPAVCHTECTAPAAKCESSCEKPDCQWQCHKPADCPRPKCALECEDIPCPHVQAPPAEPVPVPEPQPEVHLTVHTSTTTHSHTTVPGAEAAPAATEQA